MALAGLRPQRGLKDKLSSRPPLFSLKTGNPNDGTIYCENTRILSGPPTRNWTLGCRFSPVCGADLDPAPPVGGAPDCGPLGVLHIKHPLLSLGSPPDNKTKIRGQTVPQSRLLTLQSCCLCDNNDATCSTILSVGSLLRLAAAVPWSHVHRHNNLLPLASTLQNTSNKSINHRMDDKTRTKIIKDM